MNYCSIQDAWGNSIANSYTNYMKDKNNNQSSDIIVQPLRSDIHQELYSNTNIVNNNEKINNSICNNYLTHIQHCKSCQLQIEKYNNNKYSIINYLFKFTEDNKDFVILGFILLFVLLFINLINNLN